MPGLTLKLEVVTAEKLIFSGEVNALTAPGVEGELGILPHHARLMTTLAPGELLIKRGSEEVVLAIGGGYLEVRPDKVIVLADSAERADDIDVSRAEAARRQAEQTLKSHPPQADAAAAEAALRRAIARLRVAEKRRRRGTQPRM